MELYGILDAKYHATEVSEKLIAAYWSEPNRDYLVTKAHEEFLKLANAMGYTVEKKNG